MTNNLKNIYKKNCRLCGSTSLEEIFTLGDQYINDFPERIELKGRNGKCPLEIIVCNNCDLFQLRHTAPQELLYSRHYWYKSGINDTIKNDLKEIGEVSLSEVNFNQNDVFLDIGANDGTLLKFLKGKIRKVGCEPATNLTDELSANCDLIINDFWNIENYKKLNLPNAKIITAIGMFYDMEDPNQFIRDAANVLDNEGIFIAQLMTLQPMLDNDDLGNICHEHLEFYSYKSLVYLFENNGLEIYKLEKNQINGGSYRIFARHLKKGSIDIQENCGKQAVLEFKNRVDESKKNCLELLKSELNKGKKIYGYGASTKGNVILQYYNIDASIITAIADRNELKHGSYTLTDIPIVSEAQAREEADIFFVLPFGFIDEFVKRERDWLLSGGTFVVPLPNLRIITKADL